MSDSLLSLKDFSYSLPDELVAHMPVKDRDSSRLLVFKDSKVKDSSFSFLEEELPAGTVLVNNISKVVPSRLIGKTIHGGKVEVFLLKKQNDSIWQCLAKPLKKLQTNKTIEFGHGLTGKVIDRIVGTEENISSVSIDFNMDSSQLYGWLEKSGFIPLPPYIKRTSPEKAEFSRDKSLYQTIYAEQAGSVAAPTAGLHFTEHLIEKLSNKQIEFAPITLHVGGGTFLPVKSDEIQKHQMHEETYIVPQKSWETLIKAKEGGRKIVSIGTTSFRCIESFLAMKKQGKGSCDEVHSTDLFIYPKHSEDKHQSELFDGIITNFHQPESTLLMLISSLVGFDNVKSIYRHAIEQEYRFFSYGDGSLLWF